MSFFDKSQRKTKTTTTKKTTKKKKKATAKTMTMMRTKGTSDEGYSEVSVPRSSEQLAFQFGEERAVHMG
jgi:hypothetical protein